MDNENLFSELELPVDVSELGELVSAELECPGVYYLAVKLETDLEVFGQQVGDVLGGGLARLIFGLAHPVM